MATYKRLSPQDWVELEKAAYAGESNSELARKYGITEGAIRKRLGSVANVKVERAAKKIVEMRDELELLPPALQIRAYCIADALTEISKAMTMSAELGAKTAHRLTAIANLHASKLDDSAPDADKLRMIHGLTETANKAAYQPVELIKAIKGSLLTINPEDVLPKKINLSLLSTETLKELSKAVSSS